MFHFQTDWLWRPTSQNCVAQIQILRYFSWLYIHYNKIKLPLEIMGKIYINIAYSNSTTNKQKFRLPLMCLKHDGHRKSYLTKCRISKAENKWRNLTLRDNLNIKFRHSWDLPSCQSLRLRSNQTGYLKWNLVDPWGQLK